MIAPPLRVPPEILLLIYEHCDSADKRVFLATSRGVRALMLPRSQVLFNHLRVVPAHASLSSHLQALHIFFAKPRSVLLVDVSGLKR